MHSESGIAWLGETPAHWAVKRLTDLATLVNGFPFDSKLFDRSQGTPLVRIRDLFDTTTEINWTGDPVPEAAIDDGDILIGMDGDFSVAWWAGGPSLLNQRLCCVRAAPTRVSQRYLFYCLRFPLRALNEVTHATTVRHLSSFDVLKFRLPFPPLDEQQAIADFLDRETAKIDALLKKKESLVELLQEKRTALITPAVTRGLNANVSMKDSGVEWLAEVPAHWEVRPLKSMSDLQTGLTLGKRYEGEAVTTRPYLRVANVQDGYLALDDISEVEVSVRDAARFELRMGDVLVTEGGDFDKLGRGHVWEEQIAQCLHQNHIFAVRPRRTALTPHFLALVMSSGYGRAYFTATSKQSTNLASTNATKLRNLPVALPGLAEQVEIVLWASHESVRIDGLVAKIEKATDHLKELRTALISAAVTGKIDVREARPQ